MATTIDIKDNATQAINDLIESIGGQRLANLAGVASTAVVKAHLFDRNTTHPNALGGKRTNFYSQAAKFTSWQRVPEGALVTIAQVGIRQRLLGGTITAGRGTSSATGKPTKYLTIPACAEAYGKRASEFDNLQFVKTRRGGMLVDAAASSIRGSKKLGVKKKNLVGGRTMFWLVPSVQQEGDPTVLPSNEKITKGIFDALLRYVKSKGKNG